VKDKLN